MDPTPSARPRPSPSPPPRQEEVPPPQVQAPPAPQLEPPPPRWAGLGGPLGIACVGLWLAVAVLLAVRLSGLSLDDFYITDRYALNLVQGRGFVFNPGERIFGLTNPGLALLLAAAAWTTRLPIPALATALFAGALVALAALLLHAAVRTGRFPEAAAGGTLAVTSSYLWALQGGEGVPMLALLAGAAQLAVSRPICAGLLAGAAVWCRPEAGLGAGLLCLLVWRETRRLPWRLGCTICIVVLAGVAAATLYFGTPIPSSLAAKQAMAAAGVAGGVWSGPVRFWLRSVRLVAHHFGPLWAWLVALGLAGLAPLYAAGGRAGRLLVLFALALAAFYPLSGVPWFAWYTLPMAAALLYGMSFAVGAAVRWKGWGRTPVARLGVSLLALALAAPVGLSLVPASYAWHRAFDWPPFMRRYRAAGEWIAGHAPPGATVSYYEVGALGYYGERTVIDLLGIVTPRLLPYVRRGDFAGAFLARPGDYAVYDSARGGLMPVAAPWFHAAYAPVARMGELTIFARRPGVALPAPSAPPAPPAPREPLAAWPLNAARAGAETARPRPPAPAD